jgi:hypothetical protein
MPRSLQITIEGAPRTKKNHGRRVWGRNKKTGKRQPFHVPSAAHELWHDKAVIHARMAAAAAGWRPCSQPVLVRALVYRHALVGDLVGYEQAIGDMLEHAGVLANDRHIASWDGTRLLKDAARPRVELMITVLDDGVG